MSFPRGGCAAIVGLLLGCTSPEGPPRWREAGAETPRLGGTLRIAQWGAVTTLDPAFANDEPSLLAIQHLVDGLIGYQEASTTLEPRLAERWEISADGLRYRFWLREGLRYGDGHPIVAADFKRSLERVLRSRPSPHAHHLAAVAGAADLLAGRATECAGISARGDRELELELIHPDVAMLHRLAMPFAAPIHATHLAQIGDGPSRQPLASGPFELVLWQPGQHLELRRRAHYHLPERQRLDRIVLREHVPTDVQYLMFRRGELDVIDRPATQDVRALRQHPGWAPYVRSRALMTAFGARMNTQVAPFSDRRVRQALNYAHHKGHMAKLLQDGASPAHGVLAPGMFGRDDDLPPYPYDPDRARALLAEAGYPAGFRVTYMLLDAEDSHKFALSLQADLARIGVIIELAVTPFGLYETELGRKDGAPFSTATWAADFPEPSAMLETLFHSRGIADEHATNSTFYANPALDALLDRARAEHDEVRRAELYREAEHLVYHEAPWIFGYHQHATEIAHPYVRTSGPHPILVRDYSYTWLDLGPDGQPVPR